MKGKKETQSKWLEKVDEDQNVEGLANLWRTLKDGVHKRWFPSQTVQPTVGMAWYNPQTGLYVPGPPQHVVHTIAVDNTSAATATWTVPAGRKWIVHGIFGSNNNRATGLTLTIGGVVCNRTANNSVAQTLSYHMIGSSGSAVMQSGLVLDAGTTISLTDQAFVAADVCNKTIVYQEI